MATGAIHKPQLKTQSILTATTITSTETSYNTYSGRKFSDYDFFVFYMGTSATDIRGTIFLHKSDFDSSGDTWTITAAHGETLQNRSAVTGKWNSDTSVKLKTAGSNAFDRVWCLGFKFE